MTEIAFFLRNSRVKLYRFNAEGVKKTKMRNYAKPPGLLQPTPARTVNFSQRSAESTAKLTQPLPRRILPIALEILALRIRCRRTPAFYSFMAMGNPNQRSPGSEICDAGRSTPGSKIIGSAFFRMVVIHSSALVASTSRWLSVPFIFGREVRHQCR
jgi:hypothetical protein